MHQLREAAAWNKVCLPYGMALIQVFETARVSLKNEGFKKLSHFDVYDMRVLTRMQHYVEARRWVKNISSQERREYRVEELGKPSTPTTPRAAPAF